MYIHEEIIAAMGDLQKKYDLSKAEVVAEMGQAIHVMLTLNHADIGEILATVTDSGRGAA